MRSPKSRIVDNGLNMQLSEDELGWRGDKPIPYEEDEPIPLGSVDESKLENPAQPTDFTRKIPWFAMDMHTPAGKQYGLGKKDFYENGAVLANKGLVDPYEERAKAGDLVLEAHKHGIFRVIEKAYSGALVSAVEELLNAKVEPTDGPEFRARPGGDTTNQHQG